MKVGRTHRGSCGGGSLRGRTVCLIGVSNRGWCFKAMNRSMGIEFSGAGQGGAPAANPKRRWQGLRFALAGVILGALMLLPACSRRNPQAPAQAATAVPVTVTNAVAADIPQQLSAIGTVQPFSTVSVKSQIHGILAKVGFSQSYTYFTWKNTKAELIEYMTQLTRSTLPEFFRPNFFANTPDILHEYLQRGGRPVELDVFSVVSGGLDPVFLGELLNRGDLAQQSPGSWRTGSAAGWR